MTTESKRHSFKVQPKGNGFDIYERQDNGKFKLVKSNVTNMKEVMQFQEEEMGRHLNRLNFLSMFKKK